MDRRSKLDWWLGLILLGLILFLATGCCNEHRAGPKPNFNVGVRWNGE